MDMERTLTRMGPCTAENGATGDKMEMESASGRMVDVSVVIGWMVVHTLVSKRVRMVQSDVTEVGARIDSVVRKSTKIRNRTKFRINHKKFDSASRLIATKVPSRA